MSRLDRRLLANYSMKRAIAYSGYILILFAKADQDLTEM